MSVVKTPYIEVACSKQTRDQASFASRHKDEANGRDAQDQSGRQTANILRGSSQRGGRGRYSTRPSTCRIAPNRNKKTEHREGWHLLVSPPASGHSAPPPSTNSLNVNVPPTLQAVLQPETHLHFSIGWLNPVPNTTFRRDVGLASFGRGRAVERYGQASVS